MLTAVISDLHGNLPDYSKELQGVELLLICGDIVPLSFQSDMELTKWWFEDKFRPWAENLPVEKVIFIAGNHDIQIERDPWWFKNEFPKYKKITYLEHELYEYISSQDGAVYSIFGTPYCKIFGRWAFMRENEILETLYNEIPSNLDILISHDAPYGVNDVCYQGRASSEGHIGNKSLASAILVKQPKYNFHGHLHSSKHEFELLEDTKICNCSVVDEYYDLVYNPIIIEI